MACAALSPGGNAAMARQGAWVGECAGSAGLLGSFLVREQLTARSPRASYRLGGNRAQQRAKHGPEGNEL